MTHDPAVAALAAFVISVLLLTLLAYATRDDR